MKLLQLLSPCMFGHGHMLRTRDEEGYLALQCADCGQETRVLEQPAIKGPKHYAVPVKGTPLVTVKRVGARSGAIHDRREHRSQLPTGNGSRRALPSLRNIAQEILRR